MMAAKFNTKVSEINSRYLTKAKGHLIRNAECISMKIRTKADIIQIILIIVMLDLYTCRRYKPLSSLTDQVQDIRIKPKRQTFFSSRDTRTISRPLYQSNIGHIPDCSKWIDLKASVEDNGIIGQHSPPSSSQNDGLNLMLDPYKQQRQAIGKYSDHLRQVSQIENSTMIKHSHSRNRHRKTSLQTGSRKKH